MVAAVALVVQVLFAQRSPRALAASSDATVVLPVACAYFVALKLLVRGGWGYLQWGFFVDALFAVALVGGAVMVARSTPLARLRLASPAQAAAAGFPAELFVVAGGIVLPGAMFGRPWLKVNPAFFGGDSFNSSPTVTWTVWHTLPGVLVGVLVLTALGSLAMTFAWARDAPPRLLVRWQLAVVALSGASMATITSRFVSPSFVVLLGGARREVGGWVALGACAVLGSAALHALRRTVAARPA